MGILVLTGGCQNRIEIIGCQSFLRTGTEATRWLEIKRPLEPFLNPPSAFAARPSCGTSKGNLKKADSDLWREYLDAGATRPRAYE